jgi:hypothetical protein
MPIQIDHMDTTVEITGRARDATPAADRAPAASAPTSRVDLRELVLQILADGLDQFARMRGL